MNRLAYADDQEELCQHFWEKIACGGDANPELLLLFLKYVHQYRVSLQLGTGYTHAEPIGSEKSLLSGLAEMLKQYGGEQVVSAIAGYHNATNRSFEAREKPFGLLEVRIFLETQVKTESVLVLSMDKKGDFNTLLNQYKLLSDQRRPGKFREIMSYQPTKMTTLSALKRLLAATEGNLTLAYAAMLLAFRRNSGVPLLSEAQALVSTIGKDNPLLELIEIKREKH